MTLPFARDNLYNTNDKFDYGGFRELMESQSQQSTATTLFAYRFKDPGSYVFYVSTDINKKMVRLLVISHLSRLPLYNSVVCSNDSLIITFVFIIYYKF